MPVVFLNALYMTWFKRSLAKVAFFHGLDRCYLVKLRDFDVRQVDFIP
jgi:hypothetical protein